MTARVFDHAFAWQVTPRQATAAAALLAVAATQRFGRPDHVIAVARGGIVPARAIAGLTGARLQIITARHNATSAPYTQATGQVTCTMTGTGPQPLSGRVFVVDDICDTGATLDAVTSALAALASEGTCLHTLTLCRNAGAAGRPALTVWDDLREWVIFPWEPGPPDGMAVRTLPGPPPRWMRRDRPPAAAGAEDRGLRARVLPA
jgi:uncharacterized protein